MEGEPMRTDALRGLAVRHPTEDDHPRVQAVMAEWWGGLSGEAGTQQRALLLPRLFFQHFTDTSYLAERDQQLVSFLIGFLSQSQPGVAYIHFAGVHPAHRRAGLGAALYERFIEQVSQRGVRVVKCITSPVNATSIAFHSRLGFALEPSVTVIDGIPVHGDYDGPGLDRVTFIRQLRN
jgi:ribosomal protein S18 acetylase RimI-like enzyme